MKALDRLSFHPDSEGDQFESPKDNPESEPTTPYTRNLSNIFKTCIKTEVCCMVNA